MRKIHNLAALAVLTFGLLSCGNGEKKTGAGDAVIGFEQTGYTVKENVTYNNMKGYVRIPIVVTGSPKQYPITFDVKATPLEGIDVLEDLVHFTQLEGLKYDGYEPLYVEFHVNDDAVVEDFERSFVLSISYADGAAIGNSGTTVTIEDDEFFADPKVAYEKLQGDWIFTATGLLNDPDTGEATSYSFPVNISGGFTDAEIFRNKDTRLVCWGFDGSQELFPDASMTHQPVWYINMGTENNISIAIGTLMSEDVEIEFEWDQPYDKMRTIACAYYPIDSANPSLTVDSGVTIPGVWSEDYNTITFDSSYAFGALIVTGNTLTDSVMDNMFYNIVMTRKQTL